MPSVTLLAVTEEAAKNRRLPLVVGLIGAVLTLIAARFGYPGLGNDATAYLAIADQLAAGDGFGYFLEDPVGVWPPAWPYTLAFFKWAFGVDPQYTGLAINTVAIVGIAFVTDALMRMITTRRSLIAIGVIVGTLGPATIGQTYFVQTEPTFILLTLATFWAVIRFSQTHSWKFFSLAVGLQWISFLDRFVGLVSIGAVALWFVFDRGFDGFRTRFRNGVVFFLAACVVPALWIIRTWNVIGEPFGVRDSPVATYRLNAVDAVTSVGQYIHGYANYQPATGIIRLASLALLALCGAIAIGLLMRAIRYRAERDDAWTRNGTGIGDLLGHPVGLLVIYSAAHFLYMIYSASTIAFDPVNTRYLVPMFIPTLIAVLALVDRGAMVGVDPAGNRTRRDWFTKLVTIGLVGMLVLQVGVGLVRVSASYWTDRAQRYNSAVAVDLQELDVYEAIPESCNTLSNFPEFTYLAGVEALRSPRIRKFASTDQLRELETLRDDVDAGEEWCLIWIDEEVSGVFEHQPYQHPLETFDDEFALEELATDSGVTIYAINPA